VKVLQVALAAGHTGVETIKQLDDCPRLPAPLLQKLERIAAHAVVRVRTLDADTPRERERERETERGWVGEERERDCI
jgi:hypothetical protein